MNCDLAHTQHPGASRDPDTSEFTTFVGRRRESLTGYGQVIIDFFIAWSRFEYALTEAGYIQNGKHSADPDVKQYYRDIENLLDRKSDHSRYLEEKEPQQRKSDLGWGFNLTLSTSLDCASQVRNNLFHGSKQPDLNYLYPERDLRLIKSALNLLEECIEKGKSSTNAKCKDVSTKFYEYVP